QFGAGALSVLDGSQAPTGYHTAYAWHVMPYAPDGDPDNLRARRDSRLRQAGRHALLRARARPRMAACRSNHHEVGGTRRWREDRSSNARAATTRSSTTSREAEVGDDRAEPARGRTRAHCAKARG